MTEETAQATIIHPEDNIECKSWIIPKIENENSKNLAGYLLPSDHNAQAREKLLDVAKLRKKAYQEAFEQGEKDGNKSGEGKFLEQLERLNTIMQSFESGVSGLNHLFEQHVIKLVVAIAKSVIRYELSMPENMIKNLVIEGLNCLPANSHGIHVHINPEDEKIIKQAIEQSHINKFEHIQIVGNPDVAIGGCIIEAEDSKIDLTISSRLKEVFNNMHLNEEPTLVESDFRGEEIESQNTSSCLEAKQDEFQNLEAKKSELQNCNKKINTSSDQEQKPESGTDE